jgi:hemin uptake protein HemP
LQLQFNRRESNLIRPARDFPASCREGRWVRLNLWDQAMSSQQSSSGSDRGEAGASSPSLPANSSAAQTAADSGGIRYVSSADLFAGAREVVIQHEHHRYRLKITSRGGMILNK